MSVFPSDVLESRRHKAAAAFGNDAATVVIGAGRPIQKPGGLDQTYPFALSWDDLWNGARGVSTPKIPT